MNSVCVFCGSSPGGDPGFARAIEELGRTIAGRGLTLVYGGGVVGLMGRLASAALEAGGRVIGVIPRRLAEMELVHPGLDRVRVVETMHERKAAMAELSEAFIAAPGGFGTLEEFFEAVTWAQLGLHRKPCGLLNTRGYYDCLLGFLDTAVGERFVDSTHRGMLVVEAEAERMLDRLETWQPAAVDKTSWVRRMAHAPGPDGS